MKPPEIIVSLIHIQGALKGEIREFSQETITLGRHPENDVVFPSDSNVVSRYHAQIVREGNRFRLVDKSANGTFVNGKQVEETFLKDGDVIELAGGGPKMSFLTEMKEGEPERAQENNEPAHSTQPPQQHDPQQAPPPSGPNIPNLPVTASLVIQFGPSVRSYKQLPIIIGRHPKSDFRLENPGILDQHAQIFYLQDQYYIKDLTGQSLVRINNLPIDVQAALLSTNDIVSLGLQGPAFSYVGNGRLAEVEDRSRAPLSPEPAARDKIGPETPEKTGNGLFSRIKKTLF